MAEIKVAFKALTAPRFKFSPYAMQSDVTTFMYNFFEEMMLEVQRYPPVPVGSTYERTNLLFNSWAVMHPRPVGSGYVAALVNTAPYSAFVQGDFQTHVHERNGWKKVRDLTKKRRTEYRAGIQRIVQSHIGR